jgi:antitoxin Phd
MSKTNVWKLQDAKARFSEVVRRARTGEPQQVTVHGKKAVLVIDPARFEVSPKSQLAPTMADFIKRTRAYKFDVDIDFDRPLPMDFPAPRVPGSRGRRR